LRKRFRLDGFSRLQLRRDPLPTSSSLDTDVGRPDVGQDSIGEVSASSVYSGKMPPRALLFQPL
jgi:hypothetical protein